MMIEEDLVRAALMRLRNGAGLTHVAKRVEAEARVLGISLPAPGAREKVLKLDLTCKSCGSDPDVDCICKGQNG